MSADMHARISHVSDLLASWREEQELLPGIPAEEKNRLKEACWMYDIVSRLVDNGGSSDDDINNLLGTDNSDLDKPSRMSISEISIRDVAIVAAIFMRDRLFAEMMRGQPKEVAEHLDTKALEASIALDRFILDGETIAALTAAAGKLQENPDYIQERLKVDMSAEEMLQRMLPAKVEIVEDES